MTRKHGFRSGPVEAAFALPAGFVLLLIIGAIATQASGRLGAIGVLTLVCIVIVAGSALAEPLATLPLAVMAWLTAAGFSAPPYAQLKAVDAGRNALVIAAAAALGGVAGGVIRAVRVRLPGQVHVEPADRVALDLAAESVPPGLDAERSGGTTPHVEPPGSVGGAAVGLPSGISAVRLVTGLVLTAAGLPALTGLLVVVQAHLALDDDLLFYLAAVVAITLVGGFWPAVLAAGTSSLLLNWFFTPPRHAWTIAAPENLLALLLFVTVAVCVSSVVHLAARRTALAARHADESALLLTLARTVLAGRDTPAAVLDHLGEVLGCPAELLERVGSHWVRVAGASGETSNALRLRPRPDLELRIHQRANGPSPWRVSSRALEAFAVQAAAALDRDRLRSQAAQAEVFAEGNRMRTALLAAVSHDLRTPLASVKAGVSSLRQTDVTWSPADEAELLATIEEGADRLNDIINNLLDMSRIHTRSLQPFLRPTSLDEIAPAALAGIEHAERVILDIPDDLPLLVADSGLLERVLANLISNAVRYSPPDRPPLLRARASGDRVLIDVVDHGPGVPADKRDLIVLPFQQLGDQHTGSGIGLGLAVAKGLTEAIGGDLIPHTTPGGGLSMRVRVPAHCQQHEGARDGGAQP